MTDDRAIEVLLSEASAPIRWRVEREILERAPETVTREELLEFPTVRENLGHLAGKVDFGSLAGVSDSSLENACGKLYDLGIRKGMPALDERVKPYLDFLECLDENEGIGEYAKTSAIGKEYAASVVAGSLGILGYSNHSAVRKHISRRLKKIVDFIGKFDPRTFHLENAKDDGSLVFGRDKAVDPRWYADGHFPIPWTFDVHSWVDIDESHAARDIDACLDFALSEDFQSLSTTYRIVIETLTKKYYASVLRMPLPGYPNGPFNPRHTGWIILNLEMLSHFKRARTYSWFKSALGWLEGMADENGLCKVPKESLKDEKCGFWASGMRPVFELAPRTYEKRVLEATLRLLLIKKRMT